MDYFKITEALKQEIEPKIKLAFPDKECLIDLNHWHDNRYILLSTVLNDQEIHYEYYQGFVELHLEGKYGWADFNHLWRILVKESYKYEGLSWHRWHYRNQGRCRLNHQIQSATDIINGFKYLSEIFDPILSSICTETNVPMFMSQMKYLESIPKADSMKVDKLTYGVLKIKDLCFDNFVIPEYQRPYKWNIKNVNQLINDLLAFRGCDEYRLGTLVLHENNIVDGQQRIVTLVLLLYILFSKDDIKTKNPYQEVQDKVEIFWNRTKFKNKYSIGHIRENLSVIKERLDDFDEGFLDFLLNKCRFVIVQLPEISEAFQFFDSQNARGKDLEPHDLLKAFHLREIKSFTSHDSNNITIWQDFDSQHLANLFLILYRIKRWVKNNRGRRFTKSKTDVFKGISLEDKRFPFHMQQVVCHYFSVMYSNDISRKIDNSVLEYPFQIDQICINGSRFFDMIRYYDSLFNRITNEEEYKQYESDQKEKSAYKIIHTLNTYKNRTRIGDIYVRQLFDCLMLYYVDRFGFVEINKITRKIFRYAYQLRLAHYSVQLATIDNHAIETMMFKAIRDAKDPYEIINQNFQITDVFASNADTEIKKLYE